MSATPAKDLAGHGIRLGSVPVLSKTFENPARIDGVRETLAAPPTQEERMKVPPPRAAALDQWTD